MRERLRRWVETLWYPKRGVRLGTLSLLLLCVLLPVSLLYALISLAIQYTTGLLQRLGCGYRSPVPVVVVGNFTVGGTGKTPLVAYLCDQLRAQGFQPGIVSRGYGRKTRGVLVVTDSATPREVGDEALLLSQLTGRPVVVGHNRNQAIKTLLSNFSSVDVILSDDGLQHAGLQSDLRIAVVDARRGWGNGHCVPAGPLRAPRFFGRFRQADLLVVNGEATQTTALSQTQQTYAMHLEASGFTKIPTDSPYHAGLPLISTADFVASHPKKSIHAVAGIGHPARFFEALVVQGLSVERHAYPDHHAFTQQDLIFKTPGPIVMTEKDAVKCWPHLPHGDCWTLKIRVTIGASFSQAVGRHIQAAQAQRRIFSN